LSRDREEFSKKVKVAAFERAKGHCEKCTAFLMPGKFHYDHRIPAAFDGPATLDNCRVLCLACHSVKTCKEDVPLIARSKRIRAKHAGAKSKSARPMPCGRKSRWKKTISGEVVPRALSNAVVRAYKP
jgi:5-methylcytosine-specific restriction protein A